MVERVLIQNQTGEALPGEISIQEWSPKEARKRAFKKTFKIYGTILVCGAGGLLIPLVHFIVAPLLALAMLTSIPFFLKLSGDRHTFTEVRGPCGQCGKTGVLKPYVDSRLRKQISIQCPECGQTSKAQLDFDFKKEGFAGKQT